MGAAHGHDCEQDGVLAGEPTDAPSEETCPQEWTFHLYQGSCDDFGALYGGVFTAPDRPPDAAFTKRSVDLFKPSRLHPYSGFPSAWSADYCAHAAAHVCTEAGAEIVRLVLTTEGPAVADAVLLVDHKLAPPVAQSTADTFDGLAEQSHVVLLEEGCHDVSLLFADPRAASNDLVRRASCLMCLLDVSLGLGCMACSVSNSHQLIIYPVSMLTMLAPPYITDLVMSNDVLSSSKIILLTNNCAQDTSSTVMLAVQQLDTLPAAGSDEVPLPTASWASTSYPEPDVQLLEAGPMTTLHSSAGCAAAPCAAQQLTAALVVVDDPGASLQPALQNVAGSGWMRQMFAQRAGSTLMQQWHNELQAAAAGWASEFQGLHVVAMGAESATIGGASNAGACNIRSTEAQCMCFADYAASKSAPYAHQLPLVMLRMQFAEGTPEAILNDVLLAFEQGFPSSAKVGSEVCTQRLGSIAKYAADECLPDGETTPGSMRPPPLSSVPPSPMNESSSTPPIDGSMPPDNTPQPPPAVPSGSPASDDGSAATPPPYATGDRGPGGRGSGAGAGPPGGGPGDGSASMPPPYTAGGASPGSTDGNMPGQSPGDSSAGASPGGGSTGVPPPYADEGSSPGDSGSGMPGSAPGGGGAGVPPPYGAGDRGPSTGGTDAATGGSGGATTGTPPPYGVAGASPPGTDGGTAPRSPASSTPAPGSPGERGSSPSSASSSAASPGGTVVDAGQQMPAVAAPPPSPVGMLDEDAFDEKGGIDGNMVVFEVCLITSIWVLTACIAKQSCSFGPVHGAWTSCPEMELPTLPNRFAKCHAAVPAIYPGQVL